MRLKKFGSRATAAVTALATVMTTVFTMMPGNALTVEAATQKKEIVTYFANWNLSGDAKAGGEVGSIPWDKVTYINHAFWAIKPADGTLHTTEEQKKNGNGARTQFTICSTDPVSDMGASSSIVVTSLDEEILESVVETVTETETVVETETVAETVEETVVETVEETVVETVEETVVETVEETVVETVEETVVETVEETVVETVEETVVETVEAAVAETEMVAEASVMRSAVSSQEESEINPGTAKNHFAQYEYYSELYPDVNVMISVGGWTDCGYFSEMAYTEEGRESFIDSCIALMDTYPWIDGIDLDWEYPGKSRGADVDDEGCPVFGTPQEDYDNFVSLLKEMSDAFDSKYGKDAKKITACASAYDSGKYWKDASEYLDLINIMTYDMAGSWDTKTGHTSTIAGVKSSVEYMKGLGIDSNKINIGTPFYCYAWEITANNVDVKDVVGKSAEANNILKEKLKQPAFNQFAKEAVDFTVTTSEGRKTQGINGHKVGEAGWHLYYDETVGAAYMYNDDKSSEYEKIFLTYESTDSLHDKIEYIHEEDLAGIIIWEASNDDLANGAPMFDFLSSNLWNYEGPKTPDIIDESGNAAGDAGNNATGDGITSGFLVGDTSGTADIKNVSVGGNATDHGYKITDLEGLIHFAECVNSGVSFAGKTVTLAADIDMNPGVTLLDKNHELKSDVDLSALYEFPGIGTAEHPFDGMFDGNGYVIKGLYMNSETNAFKRISGVSSYDCTALFNIVDNATLKNIGIMDSYIRLTDGYGAGLLADTGYTLKKKTNEATKVDNCFFVGQVDSSGNDENWVGGLISFFGVSSDPGMAGEITNCYADAIVKSDSTKRIGMIVGQNYGSIGNCYVTGGSIVVPKGEKEMGAVQGRTGTTLEEQPSYTVKNIINGPDAVVTLGNTTKEGSNIVLETSEEVKDLVVNQCFLSVVDGTYVHGKGIPTIGANGQLVYTNNYKLLVRKTFVDEKFDKLPKVSVNEPEDDGYFGSDSYPSFGNYRIVADPVDASNNVMAVTANSRRCQLLLSYSISDLPQNATLSFRFYIPEGSSVGSGMDWNGIVGDALQEVESTSPNANFDQVMYVKAASDNGALANETEFTQGKWVDVTCNLGSFTDGNILLNFWKSIYNEGSQEVADAFMAQYFSNQDLYIDDFKITAKVDKDSIKENQPDAKMDPFLPAAGEDGGYNYSWTITENGIKGLPEICTDGSRTNVTEELKAALQAAINTEGFFKPAKNVILMIGDGMGINPVTASENWYGELIMNDLPNQGAAMTKSYTSEFASEGKYTDKFEDNVKVTTDLRVTDSSAGGTAIASGYKTYYYSIATGMDGSLLKSLADVKDERNGAVGIVTNGWISDATPAVFLSHSIKRGLDDATADRLAYGQDYLQTQMFDFAPELLMGQAYRDEVIGQEFDNPENADFIAENSMGITDNWKEYLNLETEHNVYVTEVEFDYDIDSAAHGDIANMVQVTAQTLQQLSEQGGDEGFFVMIEDGEIDMDGHNNERADQLQEIQNLDEAVAVAIKFVLENPDTILLVTADHDTGGLTLKDGWADYIKKSTYSTGGHSANNVPVYAIGYGTEIFDGQVFQNNYTGRILGNLMGDTGFGDSQNDPMVILDGGEYAMNTVAALVDTDKAIGKSSIAIETNNVLTKSEKDAAIESATSVLFAPPTMESTDAQVVKVGDKLAVMAAPMTTAENVEFTGWYKDEACTIAWDFDNDVVSADGDTVLYAGWKVVEPSQPETPDVPETEKPETTKPSTTKPSSTTTTTSNVVIDDADVAKAATVTETSGAVQVVMTKEEAVLKASVLEKYYGTGMVVNAHLGADLAISLNADDVVTDMNLGMSYETVENFAEGFHTVSLQPEVVTALGATVGVHSHVGIEHVGKTAYIFTWNTLVGAYEVKIVTTVNEIGNVGFFTEELTNVMILVQE